MKHVLSLMLLWPSAIFAGEPRDTPWPPKDVAFVVAYCYDYIQDERGANPVFPDGSLHKGIIRSGTAQLTAEQQERFMKIVSTETDFEESQDCYYPHHAFVLYDSSRKSVGWLGVCLGCGTHAFSSNNAPEYFSYKALSALCLELKLPTFFDSDGEGRDYTNLYRAEQPEKDRANVVSWPQYLKRVMGGTAVGGPQGDEHDPFAEPQKESQNKSEKATPTQPSE